MKLLNKFGLYTKSQYELLEGDYLDKVNQFNSIRASLKNTEVIKDDVTGLSIGAKTVFIQNCNITNASIDLSGDIVIGKDTTLMNCVIVTKENIVPTQGELERMDKNGFFNGATAELKGENN